MPLSRRYPLPGRSGATNPSTRRTGRRLPTRSFADLIGALFAALGREAAIDYVDTPPEIRDNYQYFTQAEMGRLRAAGYEAPFLSLEDGVADYVANYLSRDDPYR